MSDRDIGSSAWKVTPTEYLSRRPLDFKLPDRIESFYVESDDGCRLAVDVHLPKAKPGVDQPAQFAAIVIFTPYYRRFAALDASLATERSPNTAKYRDMFVPYGYAVVVVDVRGTGASFGRRDSFRSPRERGDYRAVADWIVAQPWSNGVIGSTGISYLGAASDFLLTTGHPAVKAVAPLFAVFDTYPENLYPGGVLLSHRLASSDGQLMSALDKDKRDARAKYAYYNDPNLGGPQPVDEDHDGTLLRAAIAEHSSNFSMPDFISEFRYKDSTLPYDPSVTPASMGPYSYSPSSTPGSAVLCISGWMDGGAYANGSISRYLTYSGSRPAHLLLGPWDHGARSNVSPWRNRITPEFPVLGEVLRFFDHYLLGHETGYAEERPIHYFSMHEERWKACDSWPPHNAQAVLHPGNEETLGNAKQAGQARYAVDFAVRTGHKTRYERAAAIDNTECYPDWARYQDQYLNFTSEPLREAMPIAGHVVVSLEFSSSQPDAAFFVYLTEVHADGSVNYVTEGVLRALLRKKSEPPATYRCSWPYQSLEYSGARPLQVGRRELVEFALFPTAWVFSSGSRIRVSIAGADADHYCQIPHGRPPELTFHFGSGTWLKLPVTR